MTRKDEVVLRSRTLAERIKQRTDIRHRKTIQRFIDERSRQGTDIKYREPNQRDTDDLSYEKCKEFAISYGARKHVIEAGIPLHKVFATPDILHEHPEVSQYYRGIALLSQKQVQSLACNISHWENGSYRRKPDVTRCLDVARLYNVVISAIIEGTSDWTLENGYRNILATIGISLDGFMRNKIGKDAELLIKTRISRWLIENELTNASPESLYFELPHNTVMQYSSEPDIQITRDGKTIVTIEIKGGKDPAGALERLGAMQKSFEETPPGCENFLVAGIVTPEMRTRLENLGNVKVYSLDELAGEGDHWENFINEVFHYSVRII